MPKKEVVEARMRLKPLVDLAVKIPEENLGNAEKLVDQWINDKIIWKTLVSRLEQLANGKQ